MNHLARLCAGLLASLLLVAPALPVSAAAPGPEKPDLFDAGTGGYAIYRIPGIVVAKTGTLLAYCEARKSGSSDWGHIDILMRRSTDGGRTWDEPRKIVEPPKDARKNPVAARQNLGKEGEITVNNPVAIADADSGTVHFLYCVEYARCFYMRSDDDGRTFAQPVEITAAFEEFRPEYDWKVLATGPGHGIRLRTGRLIVPVWLSTGTGGHAHRPSCVSTIYSDDAGKTWQRGQVVAGHPKPMNPSETAVVELADGRVMLNVRHESEPRLRGVCVGQDGATGWGELRFDKQLPDPVCMGSLVRLPGGGKDGKGRVLFSHLHNPDGRERKNLTVKLSEDDGGTWAASGALEPGPSAYSDLAVGPDGTIYCFYERGDGNSGSAYKHLTLAKFGAQWLR